LILLPQLRSRYHHPGRLSCSQPVFHVFFYPWRLCCLYQAHQHHLSVHTWNQSGFVHLGILTIFDLKSVIFILFETIIALSSLTGPINDLDLCDFVRTSMPLPGQLTFSCRRPPLTLPFACFETTLIKLSLYVATWTIYRDAVYPT
jgi:hypothetical protein